jgi:hypothetical protein
MADWRKAFEDTYATATSPTGERIWRHGLLDAAEELAAERGEPPAEVRAGILEMNATVETMIRRFLLVAEAR